MASQAQRASRSAYFQQRIAEGATDGVAVVYIMARGALNFPTVEQYSLNRTGLLQPARADGDRLGGRIGKTRVEVGQVRVVCHRDRVVTRQVATRTFQVAAP